MLSPTEMIRPVAKDGKSQFEISCEQLNGGDLSETQEFCLWDEVPQHTVHPTVLVSPSGELRLCAVLPSLCLSPSMWGLEMTLGQHWAWGVRTVQVQVSREENCGIHPKVGESFLWLVSLILNPTGGWYLPGFVSEVRLGDEDLPGKVLSGFSACTRALCRFTHEMCRIPHYWELLPWWEQKSKI